MHRLYVGRAAERFLKTGLLGKASLENQKEAGCAGQAVKEEERGPCGWSMVGNGRTGGVPRGQVSRCAPGRVVWISARAIGTQRAMDTAQSETSWELVAKEDAVGTDARALEEEPTRGMRSQGSRRKWSLGEGFTVRKEWSCQTIWGGGETCPGLGKEEVCGKRRRNRRSRGLGVDTRQQGHYK